MMVYDRPDITPYTIDRCVHSPFARGLPLAFHLARLEVNPHKVSDRQYSVLEGGRRDDSGDAVNASRAHIARLAIAQSVLDKTDADANDLTRKIHKWLYRLSCG